MSQNQHLPGPRRRRIPGHTLEKRKVSGKPEEWQALEVMAEKLGISVSELLVSSTLSPDRDTRRTLTGAEAKQLMVELTETRKALCELVVQVKNDERTDAVDSFLRSAKKTSDKLYNSVEALIR